jgi:hypothetical protein
VLVEVMDGVLVVEMVPARWAVEVPQVIEDEVAVGGKAAKGGLELFPGLPVGQEGLTLAPGVDQCTVVTSYDVRRQRWPVFVISVGNEKRVSLQLFQDREPYLDVPANGVDLASSGSLSSQSRISIRSVRSIDMISTAPARLVATERTIVNE